MCAIVSIAGQKSTRSKPVSASRAPRPKPLLSSIEDAAGKPEFPGKSWDRAAAFRELGGTRVREGPRLPRRSVAVRTADVRPRARRRRTHRRSLYAGLLPARAGPLPRGHRDEAVARHKEEPQA